MMRNLLFSLIGSLLMLTPVVASAITLDAFTNDLPPNPDLPVSGRTMLFMGTKCDGNSCPPGLFVNHTGTDTADQSGLSGVVGGNRKATLTEVSGNCNVVIIGSYGALAFNHDAGATKGILDLDYGETVDLNADFTTGASTGLEIAIDGDGDDSNPTRPIICTVTVTSDRSGTPDTDSVQQVLIADGAYLFLFSSFTGVDFTDVDRVQIRFDTSQQFGAIDFIVHPIKTDENPIPVQHTTWSKIKTLFN